MKFPRRHASYEDATTWSPLVRWALGGGEPIGRARWHRIGQGLTQGDPLADAVVAWVKTSPLGTPGARELVKRACAEGLGALSAAERAQAPALCALLEVTERRPAWVRPELLELGRRVLDRCHPVPYYVLRDVGLMAGYKWRDLNRPLVMTGALDGGARRRVAQTMKWYDDCAHPRGLEVGQVGYRSTLHVRLLHATVRRWLTGHQGWDAEDGGVPINQTDMAATWLAFSVLFLGGARLMGVTFSGREALGVMHVWKLACWLLGVDLSWLTDDERAGRRLLYEILSTYRGPDDTSARLGRALMEETRQIPYPTRLRPLVWRLERAKHLSMTSLVAGPKGMRELGLPAWALPWYPLASIPFRLVRSSLLRVDSPLQRAVERRGRAQRAELVALHFAGDAPGLAEHDV